MKPPVNLDALHARAEVRVAELEQLAVGWQLHRGLDEVRGMPMDSATAIRVAVLWWRLESHCAAQSMVPVCEAVDGAANTGFGSGRLPGQLVSADIAAAIHLPSLSVDDRVAMAEYVSRDLDSAWMALDQGKITLQHLKRLSDILAGALPRIAKLVEAAVVPQAIEKGWTPRKLAAEAERQLLAIDPDSAADRAASAKQQANVTFHPQRDGMALAVVNGEAAPLRMAQDAIDARAAEMKRDGDDRPLGQLRVAAYLESILGKGHAARPHVEAVVTMDLDTWLGLNQHPGELSGYGSITAELARELTRDAALRRLITDPVTGHLLDLGLSSYRPSAPLRRYIEARDRVCRFPGCDRRATHCDVDHRFNFGSPRGGTDRRNLHVLCRHHHNLKTKKFWRVSVNPDGSETWCSPFGFLFTRPAENYPLEFLEPPPDLDYGDEPAGWQGPMPRSDVVPPPPEPPLDSYEHEELMDVLDNSWGVFAERAFNLLRAAQLIS